MGTVFAHQPKAYGKWRRKMDRAMRTEKVDPRSVEAAVMALASTHPEYVVVGR